MKLKGFLCIILLILQSVAFGTEHCEVNKVLSVTASKPEGLKNFTSFPFENDFYFVGEREREGAINFKVSLSVQRPDLTLKAPETNPVTKSTNGGVITEYEVVKTAGGEKKISGKVYLVVLSAEIYETFKVDDDVVIGVSKGESENPKTKLMAEAVGADDWTATIKLIPDDKSVEILAPTELSKSSNLTNIRITKGYEFEKKEPKKLELTFKIKGKEVKVVKNLDLLPVDLDIDSNNNEGFEFTFGTPSEEEIEDDPKLPGKIILANNGIVDGVVCWADGFDINPSDTYDDSLSDVKFTPFLLKLPISGTDLDPDDVKIIFNYDASDPAKVTYKLRPKPHVVNCSKYEYFAPASGDSRIWTKHGHEQRKKEAITADGDYVPAKQALSWTDLKKASSNANDDEITLYIENVNGTGIRTLKIDLIIAGVTISNVEAVNMTFLPVEVEEEIYMFSGHSGDILHLKIGGDPPLKNVEWKLKSGNSKIGTFKNETTTNAEFKALKPAKDRIELLINGVVAWSAPIDIMDIISRVKWGAVAAKSGIASAGTTPGDAITFHHSSNTNSGIDEVKRIQNLHMSNFPYNLPFSNGKNWDDIGYHALIDKNGDVYEGRSLESLPGMKAPGPYTKGSHTGGANTVAGIGICMLGDYEGTEGNEAFSITIQKQLEKVLIGTCRRYNIARENVSYHRAVQITNGVSSPSKCAGSNVIAKVPAVIKNITYNLRYDK